MPNVLIGCLRLYYVWYFGCSNSWIVEIIDFIGYPISVSAVIALGLVRHVINLLSLPCHHDRDSLSRSLRKPLSLNLGIPQAQFVHCPPSKVAF